MGCDIHMVLERKIGDKWVGWQRYDSVPPSAVTVHTKDYERVESVQYILYKIRDRNYALFADLAGVRGAGPAPRGEPSDISDLAQAEIDSWGSDGHSRSWGLLSEIGGLFLAYYLPAETLKERRHLEVAQLFGVDIESLDELSNYRLIYWFDN